MYTYAQVEATLAAAHRVHPSSLGAFRGRIKHFQRLGLVPESPGKGRKISYKMEHIYSWAICLELAEFGLDPSLIKTLMQTVGYIIPNVLMKQEEGRDKLFVFYPNFASRWFEKEGHNIGSLTSGVVEDLSEFKPRESADPTARLGMINLSHMKRAVESALSQVSQG